MLRLCAEHFHARAQPLIPFVAELPAKAPRRNARQGVVCVRIHGVNVVGLQFKMDFVFFLLEQVELNRSLAAEEIAGTPL